MLAPRSWATPSVPASRPMPASPDAPPESGAPGTLYTALRALGVVVLALMLVAILYSVWIALENWGSISV